MQIPPPVRVRPPRPFLRPASSRGGNGGMQMLRPVPGRAGSSGSASRRWGCVTLREGGAGAKTLSGGRKVTYATRQDRFYRFFGRWARRGLYICSGRNRGRYFGGNCEGNGAERMFTENMEHSTKSGSYVIRLALSFISFLLATVLFFLW